MTDSWLTILAVTQAPHSGCPRSPGTLSAISGIRNQDLARATGLDFLKTYADGIGAHTQLIVPSAGGRLLAPTALPADAHARGLVVHGWTFRAENRFLPAEFARGTGAAVNGDMAGHLRVFIDAGMDGFFTDQPDLGRAALDALA